MLKFISSNDSDYQENILKEFNLNKGKYEFLSKKFK
jgi:hypothetical protein